MDRAAALAALPAPYATALIWRAEGATLADLADRLGVAPEAVGPLLRLAEAKLARLMQSE